MNKPEIIYEAKDFFVISKPPFMAVEPPSKNPTLRNWLLENNKIKRGDWAEKDRYGAVHRLDEDTSGILIWAKNRKTQEYLKNLWQGRVVKKIYLAIVLSEIKEAQSIELEIQRSTKKNKQEISWLKSQKSRASITKIKPIKTIMVGKNHITIVEAQPITGRTHQIRVHLSAIGHPILGDKFYGNKESRKLSKELKINRQLLHSWKICLPEEGSGLKCYQAEIPQDFEDVIHNINI